MSRRSIALATAAGCAAIIAAVMPARQLGAQQAPPLPVHQVPVAKSGGTVVMLCDGKTSVEVKGLKPGEAMPHAQAVEVARQLMEQWQRQHPNEKWEMAESGGPAQPDAAPSAASGAYGAAKAAGAKLQSKGTQQGDTYASFTERDYKVWKSETDKFVAEGKELFHDGPAIGGTIGISCDMCHPDAANTHPETYPKYQVQLQRVALLRDMISWCIENPLKGQALNPDDQRLRALEAYILAQRKGVRLEYGKH